MKRIIFVPQYPTPLRYQEWWYDEFPKQFEDAEFTVYTLGKKFLDEKKREDTDPEMFSPIEAAIELEMAQIKEFMELELEYGDILFLADISFPGFFANVLHHKKPLKCFAYCHATSLNLYDYFENVRDSKSMVEMGQSRIFNKIFVGSFYHLKKLSWDSQIVRLPFPPESIIQYANPDRMKDIEVVSASRPTKQKVDEDVEKRFKVVRQESKTWKEYYEFLSRARVLLISAHEDTFGYQIVDAVLNGCVPLAPNRCSYPEILPRQYIYNDIDELKYRIREVRWGRLPVPNLICEGEMKMFYQNIIRKMGDAYAI